MNVSMQALRAKVIGFAISGKNVRRRINRSKGLHRFALWNHKRALGDWARSHIIAYGLLRGLKYEEIERCTKRSPDEKAVYEVMLAHANWQVKRELTLEKVQCLLRRSQPLTERETTLVTTLVGLLKPTEKRAAK